MLLAASLAILVGGSPALATESEDVESVPETTVRNVDYSSRLDTIDQHVKDVSSTYEGGKNELVQHLLTIETYLKPVPVTVVEPVQEDDEEKKSPETEQLEKVEKSLEGIDKRLESIGKAIEPEIEQIEEQKPLAATKAGVSVTAYSNVPPTGTYAEYAKGMLPRAEYGDHYCYLQDASSSYVMVYGNLHLSGGNITGTGKWVRWYYSGNQIGYVTEQGEGNVTINPNSHVVVSDLGNYPMFESNELLRKEIGFYALVGVSVFCVASVLGFCIRLRGALAI